MKSLDRHSAHARRIRPRAPFPPPATARLLGRLGEQLQISERLATENQRLTAELRSRSEFVAVLNHEFKNGLTGMAGFAEMIRDFGLEPAAVRQYAGDILDEAHRMSRMLTEMLTLARLESGQMPLGVVPVDINLLIQPQARRLVQTRPGFNFCAGTVPAVLCDPDRVTQVIANLLSNALKYSPARG